MLDALLETSDLPKMRKCKRRGVLEKELWARGLTLAGIDEVGRGCLAGPVYAAAAQLDQTRLAKLKRKFRDLIRDSKTLTGEQRRKCIPIIYDVAEGWGVGAAEVAEIESRGIVGGIFLAANRALASAGIVHDILLIDGRSKLPRHPQEQIPVVRGDNLCLTIAAASILAKESRDAFMRKAAAKFPGYGFEHHVGYATKSHRAAIKSLGICPLHRRNFSQVGYVQPELPLNF
jgi:ribonuclease HII